MCRQQPPQGHTRRDPYKYPYRGHGPHWSTPPTVTGRRQHRMCTTGGGEGGHKTKRQAARWYEEQAKEAEREQRQSPWRDWTGIILERVVGHAFADVLRRRITLTAWARYELTPGAHDPDCRWRRLCGVLRIGGYQETRNPFEAVTDAHSGQSGATGWLRRAARWVTRIEHADGRTIAIDGGPGPQPT